MFHSARDKHLCEAPAVEMCVEHERTSMGRAAYYGVLTNTSRPDQYVHLLGVGLVPIVIWWLCFASTRLSRWGIEVPRACIEQVQAAADCQLVSYTCQADIYYLRGDRDPSVTGRSWQMGNGEGCMACRVIVFVVRRLRCLN